MQAKHFVTSHYGFLNLIFFPAGFGGKGVPHGARLLPEVSPGPNLSSCVSTTSKTCCPRKITELSISKGKKRTKKEKLKESFTSGKMESPCESQL